jgi:hypothetical protein
MAPWIARKPGIAQLRDRPLSAAAAAFPETVNAAEKPIIETDQLIR